MDNKEITASSLKRIFLIISMALVAILITACGSPESGLEEGDRAPDFSLQAADGDTVSLSDYRGEQPVLLYFHMALG
jgi:cytochrome oxidase Cu insertion factor (SCO1/SenC/PrrC family)